MGKAWQEHEHTATTLNQEREKIRALYRAVILQALTDLKRYSTQKEIVRGREAAERWIFSKSPDFEAVCDVAEYPASLVRKTAHMLVGSRRMKELVKLNVAVEQGDIFPETAPLSPVFARRSSFRTKKQVEKALTQLTLTFNDN